jgi:hypothetical protein
LTFKDLAKIIGDKIRHKELLTPHIESNQEQEDFIRWSIGLQAQLYLNASNPPSNEEIERVKEKWGEQTAIDYNTCYINIHLEHMRKRSELLTQYDIEYLEECKAFYLGSDKDKIEERKEIVV